MHVSKPKLIALAVMMSGLSLPSHAVSFTPFSFVSEVSTSGQYPDGDIRLDGVKIGNQSIPQAGLQTVADATILIDDGVDLTRGGHNYASGQGKDSVADTWAPQGPATITPTSADLRDSLANFNLTSIVVTREAVGTASLKISFATPTNRLFFWERGSASNASGPGNGNSDLLVEALDSSDQVLGSYKILRQNYTPTGIAITTWNGSFSSPSTPGGAKPTLGSIGLLLDQSVATFRLTSVQQGPDGINDNGPDYKVLAAVPVPAGLWLFLSGMISVCTLRFRKHHSS